MIHPIDTSNTGADDLGDFVRRNPADGDVWWPKSLPHSARKPESCVSIALLEVAWNDLAIGDRNPLAVMDLSSMMLSKMPASQSGTGFLMVEDSGSECPQEASGRGFCAVLYNPDDSSSVRLASGLHQ